MEDLSAFEKSGSVFSKIKTLPGRADAGRLF